MKRFIQCSGKDQRFLDGTTGQTSSFNQGKPNTRITEKFLRIILVIFTCMQRLFKSNCSLLALVAFLPITPSIAAITVFTHSILNDKNTELNSIFHRAMSVIIPSDIN